MTPGKERTMTTISRKVLCVDDEPNVLDGLRRQLRRKFEVTTALGPQAGLETVASAGPFAVVLADYNMPGMNGVEFLSEVGRRAPGTVTAMLTGRADLDIAVSALHAGHVFRFLNKPCAPELLEQTLTDCLEQYRLVTAERMLTAELNGANENLRVLNEDLEHRVEARTAEIRSLYHFVSELSGLDQLEDVGRLVVTTTAHMLQSRRVSLMLPDASGEYLTIAAAVGLPEELVAKVRVPVGAPIAGRAFAEAESLVVNEPGQLAGYAQRYDTDFFSVVPLVSTALPTPGRPVGVINVTEHADGAGYDAASVATLQAIAQAAAIAIQNQIRLRERNEARDAIILALAKLAEHRDPETGAHLERVQIYCRMLSETLARTPPYSAVIDRVFIESIERSSPLHDIGKVGIRDHILLKPGRLTPEEFEIMKTHATIGGDTIRTLLARRKPQGFLAMGMEVAYAHHEKFDGSGYPRGLAGEDIPLCARILAVADVYDALTSQRVYKPAMPHEQAAGIIREGSGAHFDPALVAAFFERESEFARVAIELRDEHEALPAPQDQTPAPVEAESLVRA